jgi:TolB-like protein
VLPFGFRGADPGLSTLAEGIGEEVVTGLARFSYLRVIARSSTLRYAGESVDVRAVGRELGARYVMEGSIRQAGARVRIAVQLVDAVTGAHFAHHRTGEHVAAEEDGFKRRQVSVNVVERSNPVGHTTQKMVR